MSLQRSLGWSRCVAVALATLAACVAAAKSPLPERSWVIEGLTPQTAIEEIAASDRRPLEGIWQATGDGATIGILRRVATHSGIPVGADTYLLVIVESPMRQLACGTVMGCASATAQPGQYDAWLFTRTDVAELTHPKRFILKLTDDSHLSFVPVKAGWKVNLWRLLPYMFRNSVRREDNAPDNLNGCLRIFPPSSTKPLHPRYL